MTINGNGDIAAPERKLEIRIQCTIITTLSGNVKIPTILKYLTSKYLKIQLIMLQLKVTGLTTNLRGRLNDTPQDIKQAREDSLRPIFSIPHGWVKNG